LGSLVSQFHPEIRKRDFTPECVVFATVQSILALNSSLTACVSMINAERVSGGQEPVSCNTSSFSEARKRLNVEVLIQTTKGVATELEKAVPVKPFWRGMRPFAIDGTTLSADDTEANQIEFPQHSLQEEGIGFPLIRAVLLQSVVTGAVLDFAHCAFKGKETGEMSLARNIIESLPENALLLGDRYFPSFFMLCDLKNKGFHGLFQSHAARNIDFRKGNQLQSLDHIVDWQKPLRPYWMTRESYEAYPKKISIREVEISKGSGKDERFILITTLLDNANFPKGLLSRFYKNRWKIEVAFRDLKSTFKMDHVAAKTPEMVKKMLWAHLLAYNILRWHMCNAAILFDTVSEEISVKKASKIITENTHLIVGTPNSRRAALFAYLYDSMVQVKVGSRRGRAEPRAVKKRPKPHPKLHVKRCDWHAARTS
jgi:hypothetical protein